MLKLELEIYYLQSSLYRFSFLNLKLSQFLWYNRIIIKTKMYKIGDIHWSKLIIDILVQTRGI